MRKKFKTNEEFLNWYNKNIDKINCVRVTLKPNNICVNYDKVCYNINKGR